MTAILYPLAANAEQALLRPLGRAGRMSDARRRAGEDVVFTTDAVGPAFATRAAALDAYAGRVDDDRTGSTPDPQERYCRLIEQVAKDAGVRLGGTLYADALSPPGGPADTWLGMFRHNVKLMVEAMGQ
jgi:hypothetical protein